MGVNGNIIVETDDFRPSLIHLWESTWDKLKEKHPNLKVDCYVSAFFQEVGINEEDDIEHSKKFEEWYGKRKEWVNIIPHSEFHTKPPECKKEYLEQEQMIKRTLFKLKRYINLNCLGWKASFYQMSDENIEALRRLGFSFYNQWWYLHPLKTIKRPFPTFIIVPSHTASKEQGNPDNINLIYDKVDRQLTELENKGYQYKYSTEIMEVVF